LVSSDWRHGCEEKLAVNGVIFVKKQKKTVNWRFEQNMLYRSAPFHFVVSSNHFGLDETV
jgi:hypothetical protein